MLQVIQFIIDSVFRLIPRKLEGIYPLKKVKIVAHRGCHESGRKENTMEAFDWCLENEIWAIEFDIRFTQDNIPVVHHDPHCGRVFLRPDIQISEVKYEDLKDQIPQIPTLEEVIRRFGRQIHLMIEIKTILDQKQNQILNSTLKNLIPVTDFHLLFLEMPLLESVSFTPVECMVLVTTLMPKKYSQYAINNRCGGLAGHYLLINKHIQQKLTQNNFKSGSGYVASRNSLIREINRNHDWIFTNKVISVSMWLDEL